MTHIFKRLGLCGGALLALSACASHSSQAPADVIAERLSDLRVGEEVNSVCLSRGSIDFSDVNGHSLVVRRSVEDSYLLIVRSCPDLASVRQVAAAGPARCLRRNGRLHISQSANGPTRADTPEFNRCYIDSIHEWAPDAWEGDPMEQDADIIQSGNGNTVNRTLWAEPLQSD